MVPKYRLIDRIQYDEIPPRVDYSLSEHGRKLFPIFGEFAKWGMELKKAERVEHISRINLGAFRCSISFNIQTRLGCSHYRF